MSAKLLIYFTAAEHFVYEWSRGGLELKASFTADDAGLTGFRELLRGRRKALVALLADLAGEDFHEDQIPYLRGNDRQAVILRRLAQRYRDIRLAAALSLGTVSDERRNERLLLTSFSNTQQFGPWLDALSESGVKLAGIYSVPLVAPALAARLGARGGPCLVVTLNRTGLRQCFVHGGRLRFARLERAVDVQPDTLAAFVRSETGRLAQYLTAQRMLPRESGPIQVFVVAPPGQLEAFRQTLVSDARLAFHTVGIEEATRSVGLKRAPAGNTAEQLYLYLALRRRPKEQFARSEERRGFLLWQLQRGIVAAGVLAFAACTVYAGVQWFNAQSVQRNATRLRTQAREATQRYQSITSTFPVTQTSTQNLKATVTEFEKIAARSATMYPAMVYLSQAMDRFPQIELDALVWSVERTSGPSLSDLDTVKARTRTVSGAAPVGDYAEVLRIAGQVNATQGSDYRAITAEVQRFAQALRSNPSYQIVHTQLPFDITSAGVLTGDIGQAERNAIPRFTIVLARKLK